MKRLIKLIAFNVFLIAALPAAARITLPDVIGDSMVLQRETPVPIWGHADPGESVTVKFGKQTKKITADSAGNWRINLDPIRANATPEIMTISGSNTIE